MFENATKVVGRVSMNNKKVNTYLQNIQLLLKASPYKSPCATALGIRDTHRKETKEQR